MLLSDLFSEELNLNLLFYLKVLSLSMENAKLNVESCTKLDIVLVGYLLNWKPIS